LSAVSRSGAQPRLAPAVRRRRVALASLLAVALVVLIALLLGRDSKPPHVVIPRTSAGFDPLTFQPSHANEIEPNAAAGLSHVLYEKSPGGVVASADRTNRYRGLIDAGAVGIRADPAALEAIVFVESAGRPDVIAGSDPAAAAGLGQILAETGRNLLGMHIDLNASRKIAREIARKGSRIPPARLQRLLAERRRIDARFDPRGAITGLARYLQIAYAHFGRWDLAIASYHMGIGNLERVLRAFLGDHSGTAISKLVAGAGLSYGHIYMDSTPLSHPAAYRLLSRFGDESPNYYWKVLAAVRIMTLFRKDRAQLERLDVLHHQKASAENVIHPESETKVFGDPASLSAAESGHQLVPVPNDPAHNGFRVDPGMGQLATRIGQHPGLYRALRPEALHLLSYLAAGVRRLSGQRAPLTITSTVRDRSYQHLLVGASSEATPGYSLHTTGFAFDVLRRYRGRGQALAFQFMLDRLQALNLIAWVREPAAIHVAVSSNAATLP
jgi:hypothetical protein